MSGSLGDRHLVVMGLMGAGKSTVGRLLARALERPWSDSDEEIERSTGRTARQILADDGVDAVHLREERHLLAALNESVPRVIGAAASTIDVPDCLDALRRRARVVWLRASVDTLVERFHAQAHRPQYDPDLATMFSAQMDRRGAAFQAAAAVVVDVDGLDTTIIVQQVLQALTTA